MSITEGVKKVLIEKCGVEDSDRISVALSGGADSMALLNLLLALKSELNINIGAVHIHHGLRAASDEEEALVTAYCAELGVTCDTYHIDLSDEKIKGKSLEEAAREMRYKIFSDYTKEGGSYVALGHHRDDQAETILFNMLRGTGHKGLSGMLSARGPYIRPLLHLSKEDILAYCKDKGIPYVTDESNHETTYTRNKIRNNVLPFLVEHIHPKAVENLVRMGDVIREEDDYMEALTEKAYLEIGLIQDGQTLKFKGQLFNQQAMVIRRRLFRRCYRQLKDHMKNLTFMHVQKVCQFIEEGKTGKSLDMPGGVLVTIDYEDVIMTSSALDEQIKVIVEDLPLMTLKLNEQRIIGPISIRRLKLQKDAEIPKKPYTKWFDYDKIGCNLVLRGREVNDYIIIDASGHRQKLKKYLINNKISKSLRDRIPLIAKGQEVVWVVGYRMSQLYQITSETKEILEVCYLKEDNNEG